jgi:hypothetical protein
MKDLVCLAAFVGKLLCLALFVVALRPMHISAVQEAGKSASCNTSRAPACGSSVVAAVAGANTGQCSSAPEGRAAPERQHC